MRKVIIIGMLASLTFLTAAIQATAYEVREVPAGGAIQGQVTFSGSPPEPRVFEVEKNPEFCGKERRLQKVEAHNGSLAGAVLILKGVETGKPFPTRTYNGQTPGEGKFHYKGGKSLGLQIKTKGCNFGPFTGVIAADEVVEFENQDKIKHTLHTFAALDEKGVILRTVHNQDLHPENRIERTFSSSEFRGGHLVRIICNRHDFMQNWLYVVDHPYFAISDKQGRFSITDIPPGTYTLLAWHPVLGEQRQEVQITADGELKSNFQFPGV
jgi:plastocyanin